MPNQTSGPRSLEDLHVESVDADGNILVRLPGGASLRLHAPPELAMYYRRLSTREESAGEGEER